MEKYQQNNLKTLLITSAFIILAVCCQDDIGIPSSKQEEFTVEDAREFFKNSVDALSLDLQFRHAKAGKMTCEQTRERIV